MDCHWDDGWVKIYWGNAMEVLRELPAESIQCVVTSPPFWGLRKYEGDQEMMWGGDDHAWKGAFGLEPTPEMYVDHTIQFLREIRKVLRKDGVCFWDIGDSYWAQGQIRGRWDRFEEYRSDGGQGKKIGSTSTSQYRNKHSTLKPKDLCLIPFHIAIAAQADGWWVRSVIVWSKRNPMPESCRDRPTESHEYILMLTKAGKYYWDMEAVREPNLPESIKRDSYGYRKAFRGRYQVDWEKRNGLDSNGSIQITNPAGRNIRSVWEFPTQSFTGCHFATFPSELPRRCILAATSEKGNCPRCGKPWVRVINRKRLSRPELSPLDLRYRPNRYSGKYGEIRGEMGADCGYSETTTLGWKPQCSCGEEVVKPIVLDPFAGSGTTGAVAKSLGRKAILIDTSLEYCEMAKRRVGEVSLPMF